MIRCPKCGEKFDLREGQAEGEWADIIRLMPGFGPHARLVWEYVEMFGIIPVRMKSKKILRLLRELEQVFRFESFAYNRARYTISKSGIAEALRVVCNKAFGQALESHNYLKKVMIGIADSERKEARDAADREQKTKEGFRVQGSGLRVEEKEEVITAEEHKRRLGVESLVDRIGKEME